MKYLLIFLSFLFFSCRHSDSAKRIHQTEDANSQTTCMDDACFGMYIGPEFVLGSDIAHQFSNKMASAVGDQLKRLYDDQIYSKVDMANIAMTTQGMGSGEVVYSLHIPFRRVILKCDAYTSFDHVGGWNHVPELMRRKQQLSGALLPGDSLDISDLMQTKEGLEEYWIQWRNKEKQAACANVLLVE